MFENIRLITKKNNKIVDPDPSWNADSRMYCCCELSLGMGEKIAWGPGNAIPLIKLFEFYSLVSQSVTSPGDKDYVYSFVKNDHTIIIFWKRTGPNDFTFVFRNKYYNRDYEILKKTLWGGRVYSYGYELFLTVMRILTGNASEEVCIKAGNLFYKRYDHEYEFVVGQRVKTIVGPNVKTERAGHVITRFYHMNDKTNMYQLMVNGNFYEKRYLPGDLERITP